MIFMMQKGKKEKKGKYFLGVFFAVRVTNEAERGEFRNRFREAIACRQPAEGFLVGSLRDSLCFFVLLACAS